MSKPSLSNDQKCPKCWADPDQDCVTSRGKPPRRIHQDRIRARQRAYRLPRRYELLADDERFGLSKGDILICEPYWLDPAEKLTVMWRESDGFDPMCNQYRPALKPIRGVEGEVQSDAIWLYRNALVINRAGRQQ